MPAPAVFGHAVFAAMVAITGVTLFTALFLHGAAAQTRIELVPPSAPSSSSGGMGVSGKSISIWTPQVLSPRQADQWELGKTYAITWRSFSLVQPHLPATYPFDPVLKGKVRITLSPYCVRAGGKVCPTIAIAPYTIIADTSNDGSYNWTIPENLATVYRGMSRVGVSVLGISGATGYSDQFTIVKPGKVTAVRVSSPAAYESWQAGEEYQIKWQSNRKITRVTVTLDPVLCDKTAASKCTGRLTIAKLVKNKGRYWWVIPDEVTPGQYRITVSSADGKLRGVSGAFSITPGVDEGDDNGDDDDIELPQPGAGDYFSVPGVGTFNADGRMSPYSGTVSTWLKFSRFDSSTGDSMVLHSNDSRFVLYLDNFYRGQRLAARAGGNAQGTDGNYPEASIIINNDGRNDNYRAKAYTPVKLSKNEWHLVAMTWDGRPSGAVQVYLNGKLMGEKAYDSSYNDGRQLLRSFWTDERELGKAGLEVRDMRVYQRALSASEVQALFGGSEVNAAPVIDGLSAPTSLSVGETGTWTVKAHDPDGNVLTYSVDWGDGQQPALPERLNPSVAPSQEASFSHSYQTSGSYQVAFTVSDAQGAVAETTATVQVYQFTLENTPPVIGLGTAPASLTVGQVGTWTWQVSDAQGGQLTYIADWGDGANQVATAQAVAGQTLTASFSHAYGTAGKYGITFTVRDASGLSARSETGVPVGYSVNHLPVIDKLNGPTSLRVGETGAWTVVARDADSQYLTYSVDWGDQQTVPSPQRLTPGQQTATFTHAYQQNGIYQIRFTVTDDQGGTASGTLSVKVSAIPTLNVSLDASTPPSSTLALGQVNVTFARIKITAGAIPVNSMNGIQIASDSAIASAALRNFKVYDGTTQIGPTIAVDLIGNGSYYYQWLQVGSSLSVPAYSSKVLSVVADVKSIAPSGAVRLGIAGWNFDYPGAEVSPFGTPIYGNQMSIGPLTSNQPPVIDGLTAPTSLKVGETGIWTVRVRDPEGGELTYSVDWGDGLPRSLAPVGRIVTPYAQESSFSHSYVVAGQYRVQVVITDNAGQTAQTTATVTVGQ